MNKPNILLGMTGSVASVLAPKLIAAFQEVGNVKVILTEHALPFVKIDELWEQLGHGPNTVMRDLDEWQWREADGKVQPFDAPVSPFEPYTMRYDYQKDDPVVHIELRKWADVFVIAPVTANTLGKMNAGICDNLLTSVFYAWDWTRPVVVAPAMNTLMWQAPLTKRNLLFLGNLFKGSWHFVPPQSKMLACKDEGEGALANIGDIVTATTDSLRWQFPLGNCPGIPINYHPGAFGFHRKHSNHTGVDLYSYDGAFVTAVEGGTVVGIEGFTGPKDNSPWWNDTDCVLVEGRSGVICYGEIKPDVVVGQKLRRGDPVGQVATVLLEGKERPDIPGHSRSMLHLEMYKRGTTEASRSWLQGRKELDMTDPTPFLCESLGAPKERLIWKETDGT